MIHNPLHVTDGFFCTDIQWMMFLLSLVGKIGTSAAFATIFLYSAELFPTVIRNSGLGIANFCARTGGMIAPYIPDLVLLSLYFNFLLVYVIG